MLIGYSFAENIQGWEVREIDLRCQQNRLLNSAINQETLVPQKQKTKKHLDTLLLIPNPLLLED